MKKILLLLTLMPLSALSSPRELLRLMDQVNTMTPENVECLEGAEEDLINQCAQELCGSPGTIKTGTITSQNMETYLGPELKKDLRQMEKPVKAIFQQEMEEIKKFLTHAKKRSRDKNFLDFKTWDENDYYYGAQIYWPHMQPKIDFKKPISERLSYKLSPPANASASFTQGLKELAEETRLSTIKNPAEGFLVGLYTVEEAKKIVSEAKNKFQESLNKNKSRQRPSPEIIPALHKIESRLNKAGNDITQYEQAYLDLNHLETLVSPGGKTAEATSVLCKGPLCRKGIQDKFSALTFPELIQDIESLIPAYSEKEEVAQCQAAHISNRMQNKNIETFRKYYPELKEKLITKSMSRLSDHSREAFRKYLDQEVNFYFDNPSGKDQDLIKNLSDRAKVPRKQENLAELSNSMIINQLIQNYTMSAGEYTDLPLKICDSGTVNNTIWDHFVPSAYIQESPESYSAKGIVPSKDNISVSLFSCTHEHEGQGIVAHEMGHALSYALKRGKLSPESKIEYTEIRKCSTSQHSDFKPDEDKSSAFYWAGDSLYSEEDTADLISYKALGKSDTLFSCGLLDVNNEGTKFIDMAINNLYGDDPHSPNFLRLLREATYRREKIPSTCQQLIKKYPDKVKAQLCL